MELTDKSTYPLEQSPLYLLSSKKRLADLLFVSTAGLKRLTRCNDKYQCWEEPKKSGGTRQIAAPPENLKSAQRRISELLQRIAPPAYLMAPVKRRSYVHNAAMHIGSRAFRLLDIEDFFPSCTDKRVFWFFSKILKCSDDVAATLTKIAVHNGHLPQGSPCSPILAYYAYFDMWNRINEIVSNSGCKISIYADDITISGDVILEKDVWEIKKTLRRAGHRFSQKKERSLFGKPADITGVIVSGDNLLLPNRQHKKLSVIKKQLQKTENSCEKVSFGRKMRGRIAQAGQITNHLTRVSGLNS